MNIFHSLTLLSAASVATLSPAADVPLRSARPISEALAAAVKVGCEQPTGIEFDDGAWEVEGFKAGKPVELHLDAATLAVVSETPDRDVAAMPSGAKSLTDIARQLDDGKTSIKQIELKGTVYEASVIRQNEERELLIDAQSGKVLADRLDD